MTRKEAIARILNHKIVHKMNEPRAIYISEALDMAIQALEQEPCEDAISRDAVLEKAVYTETEEGWCGYTVDVDYIKSLPSVKPATQWHKVETRPLTDEEKEIYGEEYTFMYDCKMPDDEQEVLIKTKWGIEKTTYYTDGGYYFEDYEDEDDVIAWTPLPEWEG